jgi:uncharacterized protein YjbI with pentapeptide repeats
MALSPVAPAQQGSQEQEIGLLFAQTANRGTMKPIKGTPRFNLKLFGVNSQVVWFSDRPARQSGQIPVREFTRSWAGFGFVEDPPNAALTLLRAHNSQDTVVMELGRPHLKKKKKSRIRYSAQILDEATGNLSHLDSDLDPSVNRRFRAPSLFIDDAAGRVVNGCLIAPHSICPGVDLHAADLRGANLSGANLRGANLIEADLRGANLRGANLSRAGELGGANLHRADLGGANLSRAGLIGVGLSRAALREANLSGADLSGADLRLADLRLADLSGANLTGADLARANLKGANLTGADLRGAKFCRTAMPDGSINDRDC